MSSETIYSIYRITNSINNKTYIGWTSRDPDIRFIEHQKSHQPKSQDRSAISYAIEKYGPDNFIYEVIYQSLDYDHSRSMESVFITENQSLVEQHGYNKDFGGTGHKRTQATIERHRAKIKGRKQTEEHKAKRAMHGADNPMFGKCGEQHHRYGQSWPDETKAKIKEAQVLRSHACKILGIPINKKKTKEEKQKVRDLVDQLRSESKVIVQNLM